MACWRIRLRDGAGIDHTEEAWDGDIVGIWYGGWSAEEYLGVAGNNNVEITAHLSATPGQIALGWEVPVNFVYTIRRFVNINAGENVLVYLLNHQQIGIANVAGGFESNFDHPLNVNGEIFHYRSINNKRVFPVAELPDVYRLVPAQGRGNVFRFNGMREIVELLAGIGDHMNPVAALHQAIQQMNFGEYINLLGASGWESFCLAYLILEKGYVPTGLSVGRTLQTLDIVGRNINDGTPIFAQCKKNPHQVAIDEDFANLMHHAPANAAGYYFSYGGIHGDVPGNITVIDGNFMIEWVEETANGNLFRQFLINHP